MKSTLVAVTAILAVLGVAASVEHFLDTEHYNPGFTEHPVITGLHVALGGLFLGLALLQFNGRIRTRWPGLHRATGRVAVVAGVISGIAAVAVSVLFPFSGIAEAVVTAPFALLFSFSLGRGLWLARQRRFATHREWMIRALAVATSITTQRLIFVPTLILFGSSLELAQWLSLTAFGVAFAIHCTVAELWIRRSRDAVRVPAGARPSWQRAPLPAD